MAYSRVLEKVGINIEVEVGTDVKGNPINKKKGFNGIKKDATAEQVGIVSDAIAAILYGSHKATLQNNTERITKA